MAKKTYLEIQNELIAKYRVDICDGTKCQNDWSRTHAHVKERRVCKWKQVNSVQSTFTLLHEIGHIETTKTTMRRCESEFYATVWALERCKEYGIEVPQKTITQYQEYIDMEKDRGVRRGGKGYDHSFDLVNYSQDDAQFVNKKVSGSTKRTNQGSSRKQQVKMPNSTHKAFITFGRSKIGYIKKNTRFAVALTNGDMAEMALEYLEKDSAAIVEVWHRCDDNWSKFEFEFRYDNPNQTILSDNFMMDV